MGLYFRIRCYVRCLGIDTISVYQRICHNIYNKISVFLYASCSIATGVPSLGVKQPGCEADESLGVAPRLRTLQPIPPRLHPSSWCGV
jgi:hypothetical protein